jgi:hypothetical protein
MMNNRNQAIAALETSKANSKEHLPSEYHFNFDDEANIKFNADLNVTLLTSITYMEQEANDCYVLGYN